MIRLPMLDNIFGQPASHRALLEFHESAESTLALCGELLRQATGRTVFTGMGASSFAAIPAVSRLQEAGIRAELVESAELLHYSSKTLRPGDAAVLISRSGGSVEVLRLAETLRQAGVTLIAVTNLPGTQLEAMADATLQIGSQADQLVAVQTYTGTVLSLLLLAEAAVGGDWRGLIGSAFHSLPSLASAIESLYEESGQWREFFESARPLYLLGRGPALASVYEGALLLHETAKTTAAGMSSGQFRHGPVESVSEEFRAVVFGSPAKTQELDRALARDLGVMGAEVRWIGPPVSSEPGCSNWGAGVMELGSWVEAPAVLAPIFEIVPLQFAAYRLALWRGVVPGDFRFASEITAAESGFPLLEAKLSAYER